MNRIKTILIEDEPLARTQLEKMAKKISVLELVGVFENPLQAKNMIESGKIDLILSDIQMPEMDGITFLKSLDEPPFIIFITAHHEYALEGFDLDVLDYIMKPLTEERLLKGIERAKKAITFRHSNSNRQEYIKIKDRNRTAFLRPTDVIYVQSWGDYVKIFTSDGSTITSYSMKDMEKMLPWELFIRIQRSYIVNIGHIGSVDAKKVFLKNSVESLPIGLQYRNHFFNRMGIKE